MLQVFGYQPMLTWYPCCSRTFAARLTSFSSWSSTRREPVSNSRLWMMPTFLMLILLEARMVVTMAKAPGSSGISMWIALAVLMGPLDVSMNDSLYLLAESN